ncbi:MAG: BRO family protein [Myxococcota bacterium]
MDNTLTTKGFLFEGGLEIRLFQYRGRWVCTCRDLATWLGYEHPRNLTFKIRGEWSEEFEEGVDYDLLKGEDLKEFKDVCGSKTSLFANSALVLYKDGILGALLRTGKPMGVRLRKWLRREVFPALEQEGVYRLPAAEVPSLSDDDKLALAWAKEKRLAEREARLARQFEYKATREVIDLAAGLGVAEDIRQSLAICALERATGEDYPQLKPADEHADWLTPTQIGQMLGMTPNAVGRVISQLGIRGNPDYSRAILNKAKDHNRTVTSYQYSPEAVAMVRDTCQRASA